MARDVVISPVEMPTPHEVPRSPKHPDSHAVNRGPLWLATWLALAACNRVREPASPPPAPVRVDAGARDAARASAEVPEGPTGAVEGVVSLTAPIPPARPVQIDAATAQRPGCAAAAVGYYANIFGVTRPGPMPEAIVTVDARSQYRPPARRRYATFRDCSIEPRILAMSLGDELILHAETREYHFPKVDGMGATIAQMLQRTEDQRRTPERPGRYILHSVNYPNWLQSPLVVTPNPFYDQTDTAGHYRIEHVPAGTYTMHAWFPGTTPVDAQVTVVAGSTATQNFSITPLPADQLPSTQPPVVDAGPVIP